MTENGHDDDATPFEDFEEDRTDPDGIAARGSARSANYRLALLQATAHLRTALRHGVELAKLLEDVDGTVDAGQLRVLSDKGREVSAGFLQFTVDIDTARKHRGG